MQLPYLREVEQTVALWNSIMQQAGTLAHTQHAPPSSIGQGRCNGLDDAEAVSPYLTVRQPTKRIAPAARPMLHAGPDTQLAPDLHAMQPSNTQPSKGKATSTCALEVSLCAYRCAVSEVVTLPHMTLQLRLPRVVRNSAPYSTGSCMCHTMS